MTYISQQWDELAGFDYYPPFNLHPCPTCCDVEVVHKNAAIGDVHGK